MRKISTPWGLSDRLDVLISINGKAKVIEVSTPGHGGIGVWHDHPMQDYFKAGMKPTDGWLWYEEDCDWAIPALAFPEVFPKYQEMAKKSLANHYPEIYEKHFGVKLTAEQSMTIYERELDERLKNNFRVRGGYGDWAWNVPENFVYATGHRASDGAQEGFLVPEAEYDPTNREFVLDAYPRWRPDMSLPYQKPVSPKAARNAQRQVEMS